ncbi:phage tail protein [Limisalsivibrio acetivorans]|uniref:phage tail protein n=1 Tax=Limisalsivibrio acetivorans TaxID=1304888 RepID=UPI0003B79853|nr:phage tail protein [Limisalsivibrio acetivorans]
MIGSLGDVVFEVSSTRVRTFDALRREHSAKYAKHEILSGKPVLEHTGGGNTKISFTMQFVSSLGVNPIDELARLRSLLDAGEPLPLFFGDKQYGKYCIESISETHKTIDNQGRTHTAEAQVSLIEHTETVIKSRAKGDDEYIDGWRR